MQSVKNVSFKKWKDLLFTLRKIIFANAKRMLFDAENLFKNGSFPSSIFFAISSIEEAGKLYDVLVAYHKNKEGSLDAREFYKRFKNHKLKHLSSFTKAVHSTFKNKDRKISKNISKLWELVVDNKLMLIRNNCIYSDINFQKGIISSPQNNITKEDACYFLETAYEVLLSQIDSAFGDFWIDESIDINIKAIQKEKKLLTERLNSFREENI